MKIQIVASLGVVSLLGACGGSGGGGNGIPSFDTAAEASAEAAAALTRVEALEFTAPEDFQQTGSATFDGVIAISDESGSAVADATVIGGITVTLDFEDESASTGTAGNFIDLADTPVGGTLALSDVEFTEGSDGGGFSANLDGSLTDVGRAGTDADYDYDLVVGGLYLGEGIQAVQALMGGTVSETGSAVTRSATGAASLERQ